LPLQPDAINEQYSSNRNVFMPRAHCAPIEKMGAVKVRSEHEQRPSTKLIASWRI